MLNISNEYLNTILKFFKQSESTSIGEIINLDYLIKINTKFAYSYQQFASYHLHVNQ